MGDSGGMKKVGTFLAMTALILSTIALSLDKWEVRIKSETWRNDRKGLWNVCESDTCVGLPNTNVLNSIRVLMFLGMLLLVGHVICQGIGTCVSDDDKFSSVSCGTAFLAGTFLMSAFSVYSDNIKGASSWQGGSGFYLTIVAWLMAWTSSALAGYQKCNGKSGKGSCGAESSDSRPPASHQPTGVSNVTYSNQE